jgi:hypothetical protein
MFALSQRQKNYLPYYELSYKAAINIGKEDYKQALQQYREAFSLVDYPLTGELYNAVICAALLQDTHTMFIYLETTLKRGVRLSRYQEDTLAFGYCMNMPQWKHLQDNQDDYYRQYEATVNYGYKKVLDSLDAADQKARKNRGEWWWWMYFPKSTTGKKIIQRLRHTDSCNAVTFDSWCSKYGYPFEGNTGIVDNFHFLDGRMTQLHRCDSTFLNRQRQAVIEGQMPLRHFAFKQRYLNLQNKKPSCYIDTLASLSTRLDTLVIAFEYYYELVSEENRQYINQLRKSLDYPSMEEEREIFRQYNLRTPKHLFFDPYNRKEMYSKKKKK